MEICCKYGKYQYDGDGKRVRKIADTANGTVETIFVYNAIGQLVEEYSDQMPQEGKVSYLTADHLGSPRIITDDDKDVVSRHDYLAFGDEVTETVGNVAGRTSGQGYGEDDEIRKQYTGYERDKESGLDFAQARYYNSNHGRFTSVDPLTASADIKNPQTFNRYSYVLNSPYKFTDPLGLIASTTGACGLCGNEQFYVSGDSFSGNDPSWGPQTSNGIHRDMLRQKKKKLQPKPAVTPAAVEKPAVTQDVANEQQQSEEITSEDIFDKVAKKNSFAINMLILNYFGINSVSAQGTVVVKPVAGLISDVMEAAREIFGNAQALEEYIGLMQEKLNNSSPSGIKGINEHIRELSQSIDAKIDRKVNEISIKYGDWKGTYIGYERGSKNRSNNTHTYSIKGIANAVRHVLNKSRREAVLRFTK